MIRRRLIILLAAVAAYECPSNSFFSDPDAADFSGCQCDWGYIREATSCRPPVYSAPGLKPTEKLDTETYACPALSFKVCPDTFNSSVGIGTYTCPASFEDCECEWGYKHVETETTDSCDAMTPEENQEFLRENGISTKTITCPVGSFEIQETEEFPQSYEDCQCVFGRFRNYGADGELICTEVGLPPYLPSPPFNPRHATNAAASRNVRW